MSSSLYINCWESWQCYPLSYFKSYIIGLIFKFSKHNDWINTNIDWKVVNTWGNIWWSCMFIWLWFSGNDISVRKKCLTLGLSAHEDLFSQLHVCEFIWQFCKFLLWHVPLMNWHYQKNFISQNQNLRKSMIHVKQLIFTSILSL